VAPADPTVELLARWHAGDAAALEALLVRHLPAIQRQARAALGKELRRKAETRDYVQEAMLEVLRYGPRFQVANERQFLALIGRIVENVLRDEHDWYRARRREMARERPLPDDSVLRLDGAVSTATRPSEVAARHESEAWMRMALELLSHADRQVIVLREYDGLPFATIAERLGIATGAAKTRFRRALERLGQKIRELVGPAAGA
jgi:RNA polymerase sigma-70 factor (ECF subfamily)